MKTVVNALVEALVQNVNTPGGHILVLLFLACLGVLCLVCRQDRPGEMILVGALATPWPLMNPRNPKGGNGQQ